MAESHQNVPDKPPGVPLKPTSKLGLLGKKRVLETPVSASALKRLQPTLAGGDGGPGVFLNPFPEPFDPGMSVSESEELTRRIHQRIDQDSSEAMSEIEQATEDINAAIDPSLRDMEPMSALTEQRLNHEHVPTLDSDVPAWLGLKAAALALKNLRPSREPKPQLGLGPATALEVK
jgi:hypothetical protein